jgi:ABC-type branched-subunit amino acid transport system substrate-binding protein
MSLRASAPRASSARLGALLALPLTALALAGCGASGSSTSTVTATGSTLTLYLSDPPAVRANPELQSVYDGEVLAWDQHRSAAGVAVKIDTGRGSVSQNARDAIHIDSVIAYMGEIEPGQSIQSVGITNAEDVLQFSPTDGTRPVKKDFESFSSYGRTFASLPLQLTTSTAALNRAAPANFISTFKTDFARAPTADAIDGYDAVWVLMRVMGAEKGDAANRGRVTAGVIATLKANHGQASVADFKISLR